MYKKEKRNLCHDCYTIDDDTLEQIDEDDMKQTIIDMLDDFKIVLGRGISEVENQRIKVIFLQNTRELISVVKDCLQTRTNLVIKAMQRRV